MKKGYLLLLSLVLGLSSCSNEELTTDFEINPGEEEVSTRLGIPVYDVLGYGYDVTGRHLNFRSVRSPIIDMPAFDANSQNKFRFVNHEVSETYEKVYAGETVEDFLEQIISKNKIKVSGSAGIAKLALSISGNIDVTANLDKKTTYSNQFSFSRIDVTRVNKWMYVNATLEMLMPYLTSSFVQDLKVKSADEIVKEYGTHVLLDVKKGARLEFNYKSEVRETSSRTEKLVQVEAGANLAVLIFKAGSSNDHSVQTIKEKSSKNKNWTMNFSCVGGSKSGLSWTYTEGKPYPSTIGFNQESWEGSITDGNSMLVDINWGRSFLIYDFIKDPVKKAQVEAAVEKYLSSQEINSLKVKPLYRMWNPTNKDAFNVFSWDEVKLQESWGNKLERLEGYILAKEEANTRPFYRMWNPNHKDGFHVVKWEDVKLQESWGNKYEGIDGYVLTKFEADTRPLYRIWNPNYKDAFHVFEQSDVSLQESWGNKYEGVDGYIYRPE